MSANPVLVALATAWGPKHGGINAFNQELLRSVGIQPQRAFDAICVVLNADHADHADAAQHHIKLISLGHSTKDFPPDSPERIAALLAAHVAGRTVVWIGHDTTSGQHALDLRSRFAGSYTVLIHHMAFGAYQDFKKLDSGAAAQMREKQRRLFATADLCLAVGPMLLQQLKDLLEGDPGKPKMAMLVPGLAELDNQEIELGDQPPHNFTAFVAGRLGAEDDRIKQGELAVRGFGAAVKAAFAERGSEHPIRKSPSLRMRGVPADGHDAIRELLGTESDRVVNCDLADYTEDRIPYFRDLASSSVALMPSWHEGFGLTAWEAIACQVPVVIGEQSGVYRLLNEDNQGTGVAPGHSVSGIAIKGQISDGSGPNHDPADVAAVGKALLDLGDNIGVQKANAVVLRRLLAEKYTWKRCATDLLVSCAANWVSHSLPSQRPEEWRLRIWSR